MKQKKVVALQYKEEEQNAPKVIAKGEGITAEKIMEIAKKNNIPLKKDRDLVELLSKIELNTEVPPQMYQAIAEIFAFLYKITKK